MGAGLYGNVGSTVTTIKNNYGLTKAGLIGEPGKNSGVRIVKSQNPNETARNFFDDISADAKSITYMYGKDGSIKGEIALFEDGSRINLRYDSKSGGPASDITIVNFEGIRSQKVHFIKEDE